MKSSIIKIRSFFSLLFALLSMAVYMLIVNWLAQLHAQKIPLTDAIFVTIQMSLVVGVFVGALISPKESKQIRYVLITIAAVFLAIHLIMAQSHWFYWIILFVMLPISLFGEMLAVVLD